jgi:hypothetical protein
MECSICYSVNDDGINYGKCGCSVNYCIECIKKVGKVCTVCNRRVKYRKKKKHVKKITGVHREETKRLMGKLIGFINALNITERKVQRQQTFEDRYGHYCGECHDCILNPKMPFDHDEFDKVHSRARQIQEDIIHVRRSDALRDINVRNEIESLMDRLHKIRNDFFNSPRYLKREYYLEHPELIQFLKKLTVHDFVTSFEIKDRRQTNTFGTLGDLVFRVDKFGNEIKQVILSGYVGNKLVWEENFDYIMTSDAIIRENGKFYLACKYYGFIDDKVTHETKFVKIREASSADIAMVEAQCK